MQAFSWAVLFFCRSGGHLVKMNIDTRHGAWIKSWVRTQQSGAIRNTGRISLVLWHAVRDHSNFYSDLALLNFKAQIYAWVISHGYTTCEESIINHEWADRVEEGGWRKGGGEMGGRQKFPRKSSAHEIAVYNQKVLDRHDRLSIPTSSCNIDD